MAIHTRSAGRGAKAARHFNTEAQRIDSFYASGTLTDPRSAREWAQYLHELDNADSDSPALTILREFHDLIPPLSEEEYRQLEANILAEGCRDALVVWPHEGKPILIDGHNRYRICRFNHISYAVTERHFDTQDDAILWIVNNQLGRRNITAFVRSELALRMKGIVEARAKANQVEAGKLYGENHPKEEGLQNSVKALPATNTQHELAKLADVSHDTIHKVEVITQHAPESIKQKARAGEISINRAYRVTKALEDAPEEVAARVADGDIDSPEQIETLVMEARGVKPKPSGAPKALQMSESNEWYTPSAYIEAARELMGAIDIDPASNEIANQVVKAAAYYTIETNGLNKAWAGRVWLNPPYGREGVESNQERWSARLIEQFEAGITSEAVLLVNAVTDRQWFQPLWKYPICFTDHRIRFYDINGEGGQPTHGNCFVYFGGQIERFCQLFSTFGPVVKQVHRR